MNKLLEAIPKDAAWSGYSSKTIPGWTRPSGRQIWKLWWGTLPGGYARELNYFNRNHGRMGYPLLLIPPSKGEHVVEHALRSYEKFRRVSRGTDRTRRAAERAYASR